MQTRRETADFPYLFAPGCLSWLFFIGISRETYALVSIFCGPASYLAWQQANLIHKQSSKPPKHCEKKGANPPVLKNLPALRPGISPPLTNANTEAQREGCWTGPLDITSQGGIRTGKHWATHPVCSSIHPVIPSLKWQSSRPRGAYVPVRKTDYRLININIVYGGKEEY